jgi:L-ascorbate metabolism protein UlaG (beta-lactamase superfamily)
MSFRTFLKPKRFGKRPTGARLERIKNSPNYRDGEFQNLSETPPLTDGATYYSVMKDFFLGKRERVMPQDAIPSIKTDLHALDINENILVWFGHSSYYMQVDGKRILVDPVLCGFASPFSFTTKAFKGTDIYKVDDIPAIDYLFISHDHYDHLDYKSITTLRPKIKQVICSLGTGEHLEHWGYDNNIIIEKDWNEEILLDRGFKVYTTPARHFSGRGLKRNQALWNSYVFKTPTMNIFIGGDSGYDTHFAEIGNTYGPFDLAILENGQYNKSWKHIHTLPHEILTAAKELKANRILPVHSSKFALGTHPWSEPLELITQNNDDKDLTIITPIIGEPVYLKDLTQTFKHWWKGLN